MLSLDFNASFKRGLIFSFNNSQLSLIFKPEGLDGKIPLDNISAFVYHLVSNIPPGIPLSAIPRFEDGPNNYIEAVNFRGRPGETFRDGSYQNPPKQQNPREEELFYLEGFVEEEITNEAINQVEAEQTETKTSALWYSVRTKFESSQGTRVTHQVFSRSSEALSERDPKTSLQLIAKNPAISISAIRFGYEGYHARYFGSSVGRAPKIALRFYLELDQDGISLKAEEESTNSDKYIASSNSGLLAALDKSLESAQLFSGLLKQLNSDSMS